MSGKKAEGGGRDSAAFFSALVMSLAAAACIRSRRVTNEGDRMSNPYGLPLRLRLLVPVCRLAAWASRWT